jgi:hypothetical protein
LLSGVLEPPLVITTTVRSTDRPDVDRDQNPLVADPHLPEGRPSIGRIIHLDHLRPEMNREILRQRAPRARHAAPHHAIV